MVALSEYKGGKVQLKHFTLLFDDDNELTENHIALAPRFITILAMQ